VSGVIKVSSISIKPDVVLSVQHFGFPWKQIINLEWAVFKVLFYGKERNYKISFLLPTFCRSNKLFCVVLRALLLFYFFVKWMFCPEGLSREIECTALSQWCNLCIYKIHIWQINSFRKVEVKQQVKLANFTEKRPFWEANSPSSSRENYRNLWKTESSFCTRACHWFIFVFITKTQLHKKLQLRDARI